MGYFKTVSLSYKKCKSYKMSFFFSKTDINVISYIFSNKLQKFEWLRSSANSYRTGKSIDEQTSKGQNIYSQPK